MVVATEKVRPKRRIDTVEDLYGGGESGNLLHARHNGDPKVYAWLENRHSKGCGIIQSRIGADGVYRNEDHEWKVPYGVLHVMRKRLIYGQVVNRYPWYVTWKSPKTGKRLKKYFNTLHQAILFVAERAQYVDKHSTIVSRSVGIEIPHNLVGKLPKPWKWCPYCMKPRKFYRVYPASSFGLLMRHPETWQEVIREIPVLRCKVCGITNRDVHYQRSNFWLVLRKIKPGVRRVKPLSEIQRQKKQDRSKRRRRV